MKKPALVVLGLAVAIGLGWGHIQPALASITGAATPATTPVPTVMTALRGDAPMVRYRYAVLDPTTSTSVDFREQMRGELAAAVAAYVPAKPELPRDGVAELEGLDLVVTLVATDPLKYGQPNYRVSIPGVPYLAPRPDMTDDEVLALGGAYDLWKEAEAAWSTQYDAALAAAADASAQLAQINLDLDEYSAVTSALAALALSAQADGDVAYLVMSDLDENQPQQPASLNGHALYVVQPDPVGDVARWDALYAAFAQWATDHSAGALTRVRPEVAHETIHQFIEGA